MLLSNMYQVTSIEALIYFSAPKSTGTSAFFIAA